MQITNPVAHHRRQAFIFLGQPAKNCLTRSCTSCLWDTLVWVVSLSLLPKQNQSCLIFTVAGTWIMLKSYCFTFISWSRSRLFYAAFQFFANPVLCLLRAQSLTVKCLVLKKWGSIHCSMAVSSLVSIKFIHSSYVLQEILGSPFVTGKDELSHLKDLHQKNQNAKPKRVSTWYFRRMLALTLEATQTSVVRCYLME